MPGRASEMLSAPRLPPPRPRPRQPLRHQHVADRSPAPSDDTTLPPIALLIASARYRVRPKRALAEQDAEPPRGPRREGALLRASAADFRRVDVGDADAGAGMDERVAVDDVRRTGRNDRAASALASSLDGRRAALLGLEDGPRAA